MQVEHVVCAFCGCVCDDLTVTIEEGRITGVKQACALSKSWLTGHTAEAHEPATLINGQPASLDQAIAAAASYLAAARYPLIYGLSSTYSEAQRQAVALADLLGANIDCCTSVCHGPSGMGFQTVGEPSCTLGEIKNRADLVIYWGSNPAESHPRHFTRYAVTPKGLFTPNGRKGRTVVLVDVRPTPSSRAVDIFLQIKPGRDFEVFWALRCLIRGIAIDEAAVADTGLSMAQLAGPCRAPQEVQVRRLLRRPGADPEPRPPHEHDGGLHAGTRSAELHQVCRHPHPRPWQRDRHRQRAGLADGLSLRRQLQPRLPALQSGEFTAVDLLARNEADAVLVVASDPASNFPRAAIRRLAQIPTIVLDTHLSETTQIARVAIMTATAGISAAGTIYRMDNVPLMLRSFLPSPYPNDEEVLSRLVAEVRRLQTTGRGGD